MMGYYVLFYFQQRSLERELTLAIDQGRITDSELVEIKIPVPVYHQIDKGFERIEGRFEHAGKFYEMVKSKLQNDTIYTYCLTDEKKEQLHEKLSDHVQTHVADVKGAKPAKSEKPVLRFLKEYWQDAANSLTFLSPVAAADKAHTPYFFPFSPLTLSISTPPPEDV